MKNLVLTLVAILTLASCQTGPCSSKDSFIASFDEFMETVIEESKSLSESDWESKDEEFTKYTEECYKKFKGDLSENERTEYWAAVMKYYYHRHGDDLLSKLKLQTGEIAEIFNDEFKDVLESAGKELKNYLDTDFKDDMRGFIDQLMEGVEEISEELKKELDEN